MQFIGIVTDTQYVATNDTKTNGQEYHKFHK